MSRKPRLTTHFGIVILPHAPIPRPPGQRRAQGPRGGERRPLQRRQPAGEGMALRHHLRAPLAPTEIKQGLGLDAHARPVAGREQNRGERLPVAGKVVWVTPTGAQGNRAAGIGVQFADTAEGEAVRSKIETTLAGTLNADQPTQTM